MIALSLLLLTAAFPDAPAREDDSKRASKNGKLNAEFDGVKVFVSYGRPQVKGRKVWGELVPNGAVWRAGSDEATVIAFDKDVKIEGKALKAGTYAFFAIPDATEWTLIFNSAAKEWGSYKYDAAKDVLRVKVKPKAAPNTEALTYEKAGDTLELRFEKVAVPFKITK